MRMKYIGLYIIMMLAAYGTPLSLGGVCLQKNPFLSVLQAKGLRVNQISKPFPSSSICKGEWKSYGTCCELESAVKYANDDKKRIKTAVERTIKNLNSISFDFQYLQMISTSFYEQDKSSNVNKLFGANNSNDIKQFYDNLVLMMSKNALEDTLGKCWDKMINVRSSSICSTCSGRSDIFFINNKAALGESACSSIIKECSYSFKLMIETLEGVYAVLSQLLEYGLKNSRTTPLYLSFTQIIQDINKMVGLLSKNNMHNLIRSYLKSNRFGGESHLANQICMNLVTLSETTFIEIFDMYFSRITEKIPELKLKLNSMKFNLNFSVKGSAPRSNFLTQGSQYRILQNGQRMIPGFPGSQILHSDVYIVPDTNYLNSKVRRMDVEIDFP